jgi:5'-nucleotidase
LTKHFVNWIKRPSIVSVLRSEWYLGEEYSKKAFELFDTYHPIEIDPKITIIEKKAKMHEWWSKHLVLKIESNLHRDDIKKVATSWIIQLRDGMKDILKKLYTKKIPLVIITANWLWVDSISSYLEYEECKYDNIHILWNKFIFWNDGYVIDFEKAIVHVFNKDETCVSQFPETEKVIKNRKNVILMWDSLWDVGMIEWFDYDNLIKIWFLNDNVDELLEKYLESYDLVLTWDTDVSFLETLNIF